MGKFRSSDSGDQVRAEQPEYRVSVTNFGPVRNGHVDLRPLSVFVGPNNTGKTYLAILVYALRRILGDSRGFHNVQLSTPFLWSGH